MEMRDWITLVSVGVAVATLVVALVTGYWNRKLQLQIALFQKGAAVEVALPESKLWAWVKDNRMPLMAIFPVLVIALEAMGTGPVTRGMVVRVAVCAATVVLAVITDILRRFSNVMAAMGNVTGKIVGVLDTTGKTNDAPSSVTRNTPTEGVP